MHLSESRSEPKTPTNMPSLRQLEFAFEQFVIPVVKRHDGVVGQAFHLPPRQTATEAVALQRGRDTALEIEARELLGSLGAQRIASELRIEWNSRLQTAAGRADYRQKIVFLNPRLVEHPEEIDRTLRHELAHILAQFRAGRRRISQHGPQWQQACTDLGIAGEKRCHTLPFPAKRYAPRFIYRCPNCRRDFPRVRKLKRTVACLACCHAHNRGEFDDRFQLKLLRWNATAGRVG
jgi:SprT protein